MHSGVEVSYVRSRAGRLHHMQRQDCLGPMQMQARCMARDYILRLIEQAAMMLAEIVASRKGGERIKARQQIEDQALQHSGLPLGLIRDATPATVADLLSNGGELRFIRSILLAELLLQDAEICEEQGEKRTALADYVHVWCLLQDSLGALNRDERAYFGVKQSHAGTRLTELSHELSVELRDLLPAAHFGSFTHEHERGSDTHD